MSFIEDKERLAGLDEESLFNNVRDHLAAWEAASDDPDAVLRLREAMAAVADVMAGDVDTAIKRRCGDLAQAARQSFVARSQALLSESPSDDPIVWERCLALARLFAEQLPEKDDDLVALRAALLEKVIELHLLELPPSRRSRLIRRLATAF